MEVRVYEIPFIWLNIILMEVLYYEERYDNV